MFRLTGAASGISEATADKERSYRIELSGVTGLVGRAATRNVNDRAESGTREEHAILVPDELLFSQVALVSPVGANFSTVVEIARQPVGRIRAWNEVAAPTDKSPVQFQPLALEFGCGDFELVAAPDVA